MAKFSEKIEELLVKQIIDNEFATAKRNKINEVEDFESYVDLLDSVREPKQYTWMSDLRLPEFVSHILTQASLDVSQYFQSRDFVEVYVEDESNEALQAADAAKTLINKTLNQRHLYHYAKYVRAKTMAHLAGRVYALCWWEQKTRKQVVGETIHYNRDEFGSMTGEKVPVEADVPVIDRFNYEIIDPRNIFMDNKYSYSLQQKDWIFIRSEKTLEELKANAEALSYFNLDLLGEFEAQAESETSKETYNKERGPVSKQEKIPHSIFQPYDILERFGRYWCIVNERDDSGTPLSIEPGLDEQGNILDDAEFLEVIMTFAVSGSSKVLIRFQPTPYIDVSGAPYRPIVRGLCYIHPTDDSGFGDGKTSKELQLAIDDTLNVGIDRVMLATLPTLKVRKYSAEENPDLFIAPGHNIPLDNPKEDVEELAISDNVQGAMAQIGMLSSLMDKVTAIYPTTMGELPGRASTTATAVAGSEQRSNIRANYKSLTFENTFLTEFYWMILQMTATFAKPETGIKLLGDKRFSFNPNHDYYYKPVSSAIEQEYSKQNKIRNWTTLLSYIVKIPHPDTVKVVNYILVQIMKYMGDEYANFAKNLLNPQKPMQMPQGGEGQAPPQGVPASNQAGVPQSDVEMNMRSGQ